MAIYAQKTSFRSSAQFPDFKVTGLLSGGQILVFDGDARAFVNKPSSSIVISGGGGGGGTIVGATNVGTGAEVFKEVNLSDELVFRSFVGANGITITENADEIIVENDIIADACISVPGDFKIEIDNDNNTVCDAKFEIFTNRYVAQTVFTPVTFSSIPVGDITVVTDLGGTDPGKYISATADFGILGFQAGMCLRVVGTDEQDGVFEIASISTTTNTNDTITITIHFPDDGDDGTQTGPVEFEAVFFKFLTNQSFQSIGTDFAAAGFLSGQTIRITGTPAGVIGDAFAEYVAGQTIVIDGTIVTLSTATGNAVATGTIGAVYTNGEDITINGVNVVLSTGTTVADAITDITAATIPNVTATDVGGALRFISTVALVLAEGAGTALSDLGFAAGTTPVPGTVDDAVVDITVEAITNITATKEDDALRIISSSEFSIIVAEGTGTALFDLGITAGTFTGGGILDDTYTIDTVATDTITILETFTGSFPKCVVGDISVTVTPSVTESTEWWVNECGEMRSNDATFCGDVDIICGGGLSVEGNSQFDGDVNIDGTLTVNGLDIIIPVFPDLGIQVQITSGTFVGRTIVGGDGITVAAGDGVLSNPTIDADDFDLTFTGDATGTNTVVGLTNTSITLTLNTLLPGAPFTFNRVTVDATGRVTSGSDVPLDFQPLDSDLTTLSGGLSSPGYVVWDGSVYEDRELLGTTDEIVITDGPATSGDSVIGFADDAVFPGFGAITIPQGSTAQQPVSPLDGAFRYNTTDMVFEGFVDGSWEPFLNSASGSFLPLIGGTMTGDITLDGANIVMSGAETVDGRDVSVDGSKLDGIEAGATADQSAADIRGLGFFDTTNDGAGSGLDADLLDGNEATAFATAAQGTLADSALQNVVEDLTPQLGGNLDANLFSIVEDGNVILDFASGGESAVNNIEIVHATTGSGPIIRSVGADTNVDLNITPKGTGNIVLDGLKWPIADGTTNQFLQTDGSGTLSFFSIIQATGNELENIVEDLTPQLGGELDAQSNKIVNLADPTTAQDAATKSYVDLVAAGFVETSDIGVTVQAWDADLDGLAGLAGTGYVVHTGAGTFAERTIIGGEGIVVSDGDGVAGNSTVDMDIIGLATATQPVNPLADFVVFYNADLTAHEKILISDLIADLAASDEIVIDGANVGAGADVFKQNNAGTLEFRTLDNGNSGIVITQNADTIDISVNDNLNDIGLLTPASDAFIVGNGTNWTAETPSVARTSLGLGTMALEADTDFLRLSGGTMSGTITMGGNSITGLPLTPTLASDAASKDYVDAFAAAASGAGDGLFDSGGAHNVGAGTGIIVNADDIELDLTFTDGRYHTQTELNSTTSSVEGADLIGTDTKTGLGSATTVEEALTYLDTNLPFDLVRFRQDISVWNLEITTPSAVRTIVNDVEIARFADGEDAAIYKDLLLPPDFDGSVAMTLYASFAKETAAVGVVRIALATQDQGTPGFSANDAKSFDLGSITDVGVVSWTIAGGTFSALDTITLRLTRLAFSDVTDTFATGVDFFAALLTQ